MADDDDEKTVFGGKLPTPPAPQGQPRPAPAPAPAPHSRPAAQPPRVGPGGDRTVIGGALPPAQPPQQPPTAQQWGNQPKPDDTWLGGAVPQQPAYQPPPSQPANPYPQSSIGQPAGAQQQFFPQAPQGGQAPQPAQNVPRIAMQDALRGTGLGAGGPSNPLLAAAANMLILFGRLRTGMVEMQAQPLMDHVVRELDHYEQNAVQAGADPTEAQIAKYALCGTADDIVQNLPGTDRGAWIQYSMVARFFQKRDSGVGFFQEAEKAMQAPGQRYNLLELMLVCLSLGFEGQYRTLNNGAVELARIRAAIYETLRRVQPRPDEDISVNWQAVPLTGRRRFGGLPLWVAASIAGVLVVGSYAGLSTYLAREGGTVATTLNVMHPNVAGISLIRSVAAQEYVAPPPPENGQFDRITEALAPQIADGSVEVGEKGDFIFVRVGNTLLFGSGRADVKPEFAPLAAEIARTLNAETGPVLILGFTDNIQPSGRGRYKTNLELSVARATGVQTVLNDLVTDNARLSVDGRGEADPIADNATPEGRALNRRVEILVAREGTF